LQWTFYGMNVTIHPTMENHTRPLLLLLLNVLLIAGAGLYGLVGMLMEGRWWVMATSLVAALGFPVALVTLHWLRWLIDIPALFAADARLRLLTALLVYLSGLFIHVLVLGWTAFTLWWVVVGHPSLAALAWGYAVTTGPLLLVILRPFSYPLMLWLYLLAQILFVIGWTLLHLGLATAMEVLSGIALAAVVSPLVQFSRRWQERTQPD
jgi:hypothetical protein